MTNAPKWRPVLPGLLYRWMLVVVLPLCISAQPAKQLYMAPAKVVSIDISTQKDIILLGCDNGQIIGVNSAGNKLFEVWVDKSNGQLVNVSVEPTTGFMGAATSVGKVFFWESPTAKPVLLATNHLPGKGFGAINDRNFTGLYYVTKKGLSYYNHTGTGNKQVDYKFETDGIRYVSTPSTSEFVVGYINGGLARIKGPFAGLKNSDLYATNATAFCVLPSYMQAYFITNTGLSRGLRLWDSRTEKLYPSVEPVRCETPGPSGIGCSYNSQWLYAYNQYGHVTLFSNTGTLPGTVCIKDTFTMPHFAGPVVMDDKRGRMLYVAGQGNELYSYDVSVNVNEYKAQPCRVIVKPDIVEILPGGERFVYKDSIGFVYTAYSIDVPYYNKQFMFKGTYQDSGILKGKMWVGGDLHVEGYFKQVKDYRYSPAKGYTCRLYETGNTNTWLEANFNGFHTLSASTGTFCYGGKKYKVKVFDEVGVFGRASIDTLNNMFFIEYCKSRVAYSGYDTSNFLSISKLDFDIWYLSSYKKQKVVAEKEDKSIDTLAMVMDGCESRMRLAYTTMQVDSREWQPISKIHAYTKKVLTSTLINQNYKVMVLLPDTYKWKLAGEVVAEYYEKGVWKVAKFPFFSDLYPGVIGDKYNKYKMYLISAISGLVDKTCCPTLSFTIRTEHPDIVNAGFLIVHY